MNRLKQKLMQFMIGRYGVDQLYFGLFILWALLSLINGFVGSFIISILNIIIVTFMIYRAFSRNISKRRQENEEFLKLWRPIKSWFLLQRDRIRDRKTARYRKCKHCKALLKLPNKKGKHTVVCPRCAQRFDVRI